MLKNIITFYSKILWMNWLIKYVKNMNIQLNKLLRRLDIHVCVKRKLLKKNDFNFICSFISFNSFFYLLLLSLLFLFMFFHEIKWVKQIVIYILKLMVDILDQILIKLLYIIMLIIQQLVLKVLLILQKLREYLKWFKVLVIMMI